MTLSEYFRVIARDGTVAAGQRPPASFVVRSAEGWPNRELGIDVRAPKPITAEQAAWLRATRPA